ncbi:malonyl-ACP O-methyltransferase BioC [Herbivorax sp. ANBcel31]|uniref:malonyl-ACP O-methyltransferase BioC n=1 Tax=Herbivorax sp. ANBcel31 TaxID=3069754 RepID=UPI0027AEFFAF|nr:malonyl-ACP O-methyltransferase BioC [Herbivorax sp. ANBcel31]MDQ2085321.1 malonyl-ACP O-methyltransferase BioC [Herbivorax sp. ANBcel31]
MIDKEKLKRRFGRNAKQYDRYAGVQKKMGDILVEKIKSTKIEYKNILEIGCGTGYVTRALSRHFKNSDITAVDIAPGMIDHAKSTISNYRVNFICSDIEEIHLSESFDLIVSNAAFQWFNRLKDTLKKLTGLLSPEGFMCFSTFGENTFTELKKCYKEVNLLFDIKDPIYPGQSFLSIDDYKKICSSILDDNYTFSLKEVYEYEYFDCCRDFLYSIKKIGANNSQKKPNIIQPDFIDRVIDIYDRDFRKNDRVVATYHNLFGFITKC